MRKEAFTKLQEDIEDIFFYEELRKLKRLAEKIQANKPKSIFEVFTKKQTPTTNE